MKVRRTSIAFMLFVLIAIMSGRTCADEPEYSGVFACLGCHSAGEQTPYVDSLPLVRMDEVRVWHDQDKHSLAYCVLNGELGRRMSERLGYDVSQAAACLACHAPRHEQRSADSAAPPNYKLAEGVSCEDCHGGSRGWHRLHVLKDQWRGLTPEQKQSHGMNDLRDPLQRATICLDCHVGNASQGQQVTHAMYAAGHPPLASIDIVAYANDMPRHWRAPAEQADRSATVANATTTADVQMALIGHLVAAERSLTLAAQQFKTLPDFAHFDCDACHHELSSPSWRQARFAQGVPGRPLYREWPLRMATLASHIAGSELTTSLDELNASLQAQPFGGNGQAASAASLALANMFSTQAQALAKADGRAEHGELVELILAHALDSERPPDYDTARTLAWLLHHALPVPGGDAELAWNELVGQLGLAIPPRVDVVKNASLEPACGALTPEPIADNLPAALRPRAEFDPARFQAGLRRYVEASRRELRLPNANALHR